MLSAQGIFEKDKNLLPVSSTWPSRPLDSTNRQLSTMQCIQEQQVATVTRQGRSIETQRQSHEDTSLYGKRQRDRECRTNHEHTVQTLLFFFQFCLALFYYGGCHRSLQHAHEQKQGGCTRGGAAQGIGQETQPHAQEGMKRRLGGASTYNSASAKTMNGQSSNIFHFPALFHRGGCRGGCPLHEATYWNRHSVCTCRGAASGQGVGEVGYSAGEDVKRSLLAECTT